MAELCSRLVHGNDQPIWKGSFDDIAWHRLLLFLAGGERCTSTLSQKGYSQLPASHIGGVAYIRLSVSLCWESAPVDRRPRWPAPANAPRVWPILPRHGARPS